MSNVVTPSGGKKRLGFHLFALPLLTYPGYIGQSISSWWSEMFPCSQQGPGSLGLASVAGQSTCLDLNSALSSSGGNAGLWRLEPLLMANDRKIK